jgi:hypothetical protein
VGDDKLNLKAADDNFLEWWSKLKLEGKGRSEVGHQAFLAGWTARHAGDAVNPDATRLILRNQIAIMEALQRFGGWRQDTQSEAIKCGKAVAETKAFLEGTTA